MRSPDIAEIENTFDHRYEHSITKEPSAPAIITAMSHERNGKHGGLDYHPPTTLKTNGINMAGNGGINTSISTLDSTEARLRRRYDNEQENDDSTQLVSAAVGPNRAIARDGLLKQEFELIPKKRVSAGLSTAQRRENQTLNRDPQVLPYEDTRVMLRPNKHNPHGYVNASHVQASCGF